MIETTVTLTGLQYRSLCELQDSDARILALFYPSIVVVCARPVEVIDGLLHDFFAVTLRGDIRQLFQLGLTIGQLTHGIPIQSPVSGSTPVR